MRRTYLDWAAGAPVLPEAMRASVQALQAYGNPSSPHAEGRAARAIVEDARVRIARLASVKADAVLFTSGATEANALALVGQIRARIAKGAPASALHVLYLPSAHASTRGAIKEIAALGVSVEPLSLADGKIDLEALKKQLRPETVLIALEAVCGETGTRFDTRGVRRVAGASVSLHVDASQLPLIESFELTRLAADTLSLDAQKVGGVRGIGALIAPRQVAIAPLVRGGAQERGLRPGTEPHAAARAFACALEAAHAGSATFRERAQAQRERLRARLTEVPDLVENEGGAQAPHIWNISLLGRDTDYLAALLDEAGFAVSTRSACTTDEEGSAAVLALTGDPDRAASTLRVSWGPATRDRDLARFIDALLHAVRFLDAHAL